MAELPTHLEKFKFKKGDAGIPCGHKTHKGPLLRTIIRKVLDTKIDLQDPITREKYNMSINHFIALQLTKRAMEGNLKAISLLYDRLEGRAGNSLEITGPGGGPLQSVNRVEHDFSKLSVDELMSLRSTLEKIESVSQVDYDEDEEPEIFDVEYEESLPTEVDFS